MRVHAFAFQVCTPSNKMPILLRCRQPGYRRSNLAWVRRTYSIYNITWQFVARHAPRLLFPLLYLCRLSIDVICDLFSSHTFSISSPSPSLSISITRSFSLVLSLSIIGVVVVLLIKYYTSVCVRRECVNGIGIVFRRERKRVCVYVHPHSLSLLKTIPMYSCLAPPSPTRERAC